MYDQTTMLWGHIRPHEEGQTPVPPQVPQDAALSFPAAEERTEEIKLGKEEAPQSCSAIGNFPRICRLHTCENNSRQPSPDGAEIYK